MAAILEADTITKLPPEAAGAVIVSGSHGGLYPAYLAAKAGVRAVILNDAGIGREKAGIASLAYLQGLGIAAACVSHLSCRIGDTADMMARGTVSSSNSHAQACGVEPGLACHAAAERLCAAILVDVGDPPSVSEGRGEIEISGIRRILTLDSAAMVRPDDAGAIIVTGSHGGLVGGKPAMALRTDGFAAVFNDAGIGIDAAGTPRLPVLDERGIAAFTVSADSARIGDSLSTYEDGVISVVNRRAAELGATVGQRAQDVLDRWAAG